MSPAPSAAIDGVRVRAYVIPTDAPEADGTFAWTSTTLVAAEVTAGASAGLGYTYTSEAAVPLIAGPLAQAVRGADAMDPPSAWRRMTQAVRNIGRSGLAATAISAVDAAVWDLKARLLGLPLATLMGRARDAAPIYGSGGFTSYDDATLCRQLAGWVERAGCRWVKMKIGTDPDRDPGRVASAKRAVGDAVLFVDANGALTPRQALGLAQVFADEADVRWFEEPVSSDDWAGLARVRAGAPGSMDIAAGEYGYALDDFRHWLETGCVDVLQADVTRCGGYTGFLQAGALAEAFHTDLSGHCAPALHVPAACAVPRLRHLEWFHDHARIEAMLFDGAPEPRGGVISPDLGRPGHGLEFKQRDAERWRVA